MHTLWHVPTPPWQGGDFVALYTAALTWWRQMPREWRSPIWPAAAALVTFLVLLVSFHQVVSGVVARAALQRQASAVHGEDALRCSLLGDKSARAQCLLLVNGHAVRAATQRDRGVAAGEQIAKR